MERVLSLPAFTSLGSDLGRIPRLLRRRNTGWNTPLYPESFGEYTGRSGFLDLAHYPTRDADVWLQLMTVLSVVTGKLADR